MSTSNNRSFSSSRSTLFQPDPVRALNIDSCSLMILFHNPDTANLFICSNKFHQLELDTQKITIQTSSDDELLEALGKLSEFCPNSNVVNQTLARVKTTQLDSEPLPLQTPAAAG